MKIIDRIRNSGPFYSLEFFPPKDRSQWPRFFQTAEKLRTLDPLFVSVTYGAGGHSQENTLEITTLFAHEGYCPMAHLTCVGALTESLTAYLHKLADAGVYNVLALRGDPPKDKMIVWDACEFSYASDLVSFIHRKFPFLGIGVAGYLTPHAESPSFAADRRATANKLNAGSDFCITQLFFDPREYFEYVEQMRLLGVTKPIVPGVLPIQSMESLRRVLSLSACSMPAKFFLDLEKADREGGQAAVRELGLVYAAKQIKALLDGGAPGIHLYTLNMADLCLQLADRVRNLQE
ncbi:MAG: methylenetetrahydrofolate reductase [Desulfovibrio sp.]|jgi:methylenetetrahydrofolate reductase (NADPH)|nr:methylenetetrahydrofolate reductase [Desulfovibrio sp.]